MNLHLSRHFSRAVTFSPLFNTCQGTLIVTLAYFIIAKIRCIRLVGKLINQVY
jgi:hypothetical protein